MFEKQNIYWTEDSILTPSNTTSRIANLKKDPDQIARHVLSPTKFRYKRRSIRIDKSQGIDFQMPKFQAATHEPK